MNFLRDRHGSRHRPGTRERPVVLDPTSLKHAVAHALRERSHEEVLELIRPEPAVWRVTERERERDVRDHATLLDRALSLTSDGTCAATSRIDVRTSSVCPGA